MKKRSKNPVNSKPSIGIENTCICQESINVKDSYPVKNNNSASIEELYMGKGGLPAGAYDRKDLLLSICVSWNSSVSFLLGICFPLIKQEGYQWLSHQGIVPPLLVVFPQMLRPRENAVENKSNRYVLWGSTNYRSWERGSRSLFLLPSTQPEFCCWVTGEVK